MKLIKEEGTIVNLNILDRPIAFHRCLAEIAGSADGGLFLSQLLYWHNRVEKEYYKTIDDIYQETMIKEDRQRSIRKQLKRKGIITERFAGIPPKLYFTVHTEIIAKLLNIQSTGIPGDNNPVQPGMLPGIPGDIKETETTTETTTKDLKHNCEVSLVDEIFSDYKTILGHSRARMGPKRRKLINAAIKAGYNRQDLADAFHGCKRSSFHQGYNLARKKHDSIELILRDEGNIDRFRAYRSDPPAPTWKAGMEPPLAIMRRAREHYEWACIRVEMEKPGTGGDYIEGSTGQVVNFDGSML